MASVFSKPVDIAPVVGWEELYWATSKGDVWSVRKRVFLKTGKNRGGYQHVSLFKDGKGKTTCIHRIVAQLFVPNDCPETRKDVDHVNRMRTDNRASNLRWSTRSENLHNKTKQEGCTSQYYGVCWHAQRNKWVARIKEGYIGLYESEEEAARAYDSRAKEVHGVRCRLNFQDSAAQSSR